MKFFKNSENKRFAFEDTDFDEEGKCINQHAIKVIHVNSLIEITEEEAKELLKSIVTKEQKIQQINNKAYEEIIEIYPLWKQQNIIRNKDLNNESLDLYNQMSSFIDFIRAYSDEEIKNIV